MSTDSGLWKIHHVDIYLRGAATLALLCCKVRGAGNLACSRLSGGIFGSRMNPCTGEALAESRLQPGLAAPLLLALVASAGLHAGTFPIEVRTFFTTADGLPSNNVTALVISRGKIFAKTAAGAAQLPLPSRDRKGADSSEGRW